MGYAERLYNTMLKKGLNIQSLAEKAEVSRYCIYSNINGKTTPDAHTLGKLADVLGVSMDWLWGRTDDITPTINKKKEVRKHE